MQNPLDSDVVVTQGMATSLFSMLALHEVGVG